MSKELFHYSCYNLELYREEADWNRQERNELKVETHPMTHAKLQCCRDRGLSCYVAVGLYTTQTLLWQ